MITVDVSGLEVLDKLAEFIESKVPEFLARCAELGVTVAQWHYSMAVYDGTNDVTVTWEERGANTVAIIATGIFFINGPKYQYCTCN